MIDISAQDATALEVHLQTQKTLQGEKGKCKTMTNIVYYKWTTADEIKYVKGLGTRKRQEGINSGLTRLEMLLKYRDTLNQRVEWGDIEPVEVSVVVEKMIVAERRRIDHGD